MSLGRQLAGTALLMAVLTLLGKVVGLLREMVVAGAFGAGADLDAFLIGYTLPEMASFIALYVALYLFVPLYLELRERDPGDADAFAAAFLGRAALLLLGSALALGLAAGWIVSVLAPDLPDRGRSIAVFTLRALAVVVLFRGLEGALRGVLNAHRRFIRPLVATLTASAIVIVGVVGFADRLGVQALGLGILVGSAGPLLLLLPATGLRRVGVRRLTRNHPALARVRQRLLWFLGIEALGLAVPLIDRALASRSLDPGAVSALNFARILYEVPFQAVALTLAVALFPELSTLWARGDREGFRRLLRRSVRAVLAILLPVALLFVALRRSVVEALFRRGAFDAGDVDLTAAALLGLTLGLPFLAAASLLFHGAIAAGRYRLLMAARVSSLLVKVVVSVVLVRFLGVSGLALGTAAHFVVLFAILAPVGGGSWRGWVPRPAVLLPAALVATGVAWSAIRLWEGSAPGGDPWPLVGQSLAWVAGAVVYVVLCRLGGVEEVRWLERVLRGRLAEAGNPAT